MNDGVHTSLEPRPKPDTTLPFMRRGKGASGPLSDPIILGRGPSWRIVAGLVQAFIREIRELTSVYTKKE